MPNAIRNDWRPLFPFESRWFATGAGRIHYVDEGPTGVDEGPSDGAGTLLFVHGNPTWSFHWRELILGLRDKYRCVAIDHLGCGLSDKPNKFFRLSDRIAHLVGLIDELGLQRITLVAQDWGGAIGIGGLLDRRELFQRIVLFNTGAFPPPYIPWRIRVCRTPIFGRIALQGMNAFSHAALRMTLSRQRQLNSAVAAAYVAPYGSWAERLAVYNFVKDIPASPAHPTWQTLEKIENKLPTVADLPSCIVWGLQDWCFRPECLERFQAAWPEATIYRLPDVGHWVLEDAPEEATKIVCRWLDENEAGT